MPEQSRDFPNRQQVQLVLYSQCHFGPSFPGFFLLEAPNGRGGKGVSLELVQLKLQCSIGQLSEGQWVKSCLWTACRREARLRKARAWEFRSPGDAGALGLPGRAGAGGWGDGTGGRPFSSVSFLTPYPSLGFFSLLQLGHGPAKNLPYGQCWIWTQRGPVWQRLVRTG